MGRHVVGRQIAGAGAFVLCRYHRGQQFDPSLLTPPQQVHRRPYDVGRVAEAPGGDLVGGELLEIRREGIAVHG